MRLFVLLLFSFFFLSACWPVSSTLWTDVEIEQKRVNSTHVWQLFWSWWLFLWSTFSLWDWYFITSKHVLLHHEEWAYLQIYWLDYPVLKFWHDPILDVSIFKILNTGDWWSQFFLSFKQEVKHWFVGFSRGNIIDSAISKLPWEIIWRKPYGNMNYDLFYLVLDVWLALWNSWSPFFTQEGLVWWISTSTSSYLSQESYILPLFDEVISSSLASLAPNNVIQRKLPSFTYSLSKDSTEAIVTGFIDEQQSWLIIWDRIQAINWTYLTSQIPFLYHFFSVPYSWNMLLHIVRDGVEQELVIEP